MNEFYKTSYNYSFDLSDFISKEDKEAVIKKLLENEDDLMPILKQYLVKYLDSVMENPESIVKDLIKEKDDRISNLEKKVEKLERQIESYRLNQPTPLGNYPPYSVYNGLNDNLTTTTTTGYITTV